MIASGKAFFPELTVCHGNQLAAGAGDGYVDQAGDVTVFIAGHQPTGFLCGVTFYCIKNNHISLGALELVYC